MDPKGLNQLDPKLKEAYDRVMGLSTTTASPASYGGQSSTDSTPDPNVQNPATPTPPSSEPTPPIAPPSLPATPQPTPENNPFSPPPASINDLPPLPGENPADLNPPPPPPLQEAPTQTETIDPNPPQPSRTPASSNVFQSFNASNGVSESESAQPKAKSTTKLSTPVLAILGLTFFIVYALLWVKLFGLI